MAKILFERDAQQALLAGAKTFSRAVGSTLGPGGRLVGLSARGGHVLTKDGVTVARETTLPAWAQNIAANMIRGAAEAVVSTAGDGTTTVAVLVGALLEEAGKYTAAGLSPVLVARGIRDKAAEVDATLRAMVVPANTREEIYRVAYVASNGDDEIANLVADALMQAGPDGVITIENNFRSYSRLNVVRGAQYPTGWTTPEFATNKERMTATFEQPYIFLCEAHLHPMPPLGPLLERVHSSGRPVLIFCDSISGPALKTLLVNNRRKTLRSVAVTSPYFADIKTDTLRDLAALTGATVYSPVLGRRLQDWDLRDLGEARSVVVSKFSTQIIGAGGSPEAIAARVEYLKAACEREQSQEEKKRLRERLAKLAGGVAIIEAGGVTELESKERRDRIDDALNAARHAMAGGVLPGGGAALVHASKGLRAAADDAHDNAAVLMRRACTAPLLRIASNAGARAEAVLGEVLKSPSGFGYDAKSEEVCDLVAAGVVDPAQVTITALAKAAETAALIINTGCVMYNEGVKK
jgi:chaperonin GroEL